MKVAIDHIAKIEGHMGFVGHILKGNVSKAKLEITQGARLIEGIIIDRHYEDAPLITSRICGVCPVVHNICAIKAMEDALKIEISEGVKILRELLLIGQIIQSHSLHLFFLTLPDYFKNNDTIKLTEKLKKETKQANNIRAFSDKLVEVIGGRAIHTTNTKIGGFGRLPEKEQLKKLQTESKKTLKQALSLAEIFKKLPYPDLYRKTEFVSLSDPQEYAFYRGRVNASDKEPLGIRAFLPKITEIESPLDVVKRGRYKGKSYMVGALARINNNKHQLNPLAKKLVDDFFVHKINYNTFHNIYAQAVEIVHFLEEIDKLIDKFLKENYSEQEIIIKDSPIPQKTAWGVGAVEAPRGILFHIYKIDKQGIVRECDIITPTAQFLENLEQDLKVFLPGLKKISAKDRERKIKMLIRAYDPCISCATH